MSNAALPDSLKNKTHWDWPPPFNKIPRAWTSFDWGKPKLVAGSAELIDGAPKPINPEGTWQLSYFPDAPLWAKPFAWFIGKSGKKGSDGKFRNFRIGTRWDNEDNYVNCTFVPLPSSRKYTGEAAENTGTGPMKTN